MKFLADMGISQTTVRWLKDNGYDAIHLRELNLHRLPDSKIIEKARDEGRIILTCDLDFGALMSASQGTLPSVIIFRLEDETPININNRLKTILKDVTAALDRGAIISVEEKRHRVRFLPV
ncbi:DUF5615 family PIN-like protein [bacterium]|nr:DUF5615 family PIN-like protein [bacterium]